jgi:hypothetical protein
MFCALGLFFGGTEGVRFCFHVWCARTHFRRHLGRRVLFSHFTRPNSFSAVPTTSGPVFMVCAPRHVFGGAKGVGSRFHVLRVRSHFRRYRGRRLPISSFALPDSFSAVPRVSAPVFMFCGSGLFFGGTERIGTHFHVLRSVTRFPRYRGRRLPFTYFARPYSFYQRCGGHRVPFSCFALPESFSAVPRASPPVFMFYAPGYVFGATKGVGSHFHVFLSRTHIPR